MNRYERLKQLLGMGDGDVGFRANGVATASPIGGLAADAVQALAVINASGYVRKTLTESDVYVHTIEAASSRFISDRFAFLDQSTLANIAKEAAPGFAVLTRHATGGFLSGDGENPYGRTFAGAVDSKDGVTRSLVQFYMLRDYKPNGDAAASTDALDKGINGGVLFDVSVGLKRGGTGKLVCDICHFELFASCTHMPGTTEEMTTGEIDRQKKRGVPGGAATFSFVDYHPKEVSFVFDGAVEGAGTALATQPTTAPPRPQEGKMYPKELKIKLGLAETATDAEVDAKLASLQTDAGKVGTLEAERKAEKDAAFNAKVKDKLTVDEIAMITAAPNRDQLADTLIAAKSGQKPAAPPVGDPLKGTAAAAATATASLTGEFHETSEEMRGIIGAFDDNAKLEAAAMTSPLKALQGVLGLKTIRPDGEQLKADARTLKMRKSAFQIVTVNA